MAKPKNRPPVETAQPKTGNNWSLLVIDVQQELFEKSNPIYGADHLLENLCALTGRAYSAGWPVIFVQHSAERYLVKGSPGWMLHPRLQPFPGDRIIYKRHGNSFQDTDLERILDAQDVGTVVVCGLVSHGCVQATCEGAKALGYRVILAEDGHSNYHKQAAEKIAEVNRTLVAAGTVELQTVENLTFSVNAEIPVSG